MPESTINLSQEKMKFFLSNMFSHDSALHDFVDMLRLILTRDYMNRTILPPGFMAGGCPTDKGQHGGMVDDGEGFDSDASQGAEGFVSMSQESEYTGPPQGTAQADTRASTAAEEGVAGAPRAAEEGVAGAPRAAQAEEQRQQEVTHQTQSKDSRLKRKLRP